MSRTLPAVVFLTVLLAGAAPAARSLEVGAQVQDDPAGIAVTVWGVDPPIDTILGNIADGMRAEINFQIEVYRVPHGFFRLFGDRLVEDIHVSRVAAWDLYQKAYVIRQSDGSGDEPTATWIQDRQEFARSLFRLDRYKLPWKDFGDDVSGRSDLASLGRGAAYVLVRVQVRPMKLVPALAILSFLRMEDEIVSSWERLDIQVSR